MSIDTSSALRDFYNSYPVPEMSTAADLALPIIESGGVVILSGMCGIHKSLGFLSKLAFALDKPEVAPWHDLIDSHIPIEKQPRLFDEATELALEADGANLIAGAIDSGAVVFAGLRKSSRDTARGNLLNALNERCRPTTDLGDITRTSVSSDQASTLLSRLGFDSQYVDFIEEHEVMRNPRFFALVTGSLRDNDRTSFDDLRRLFDASVSYKSNSYDAFKHIVLNVAQTGGIGSGAAPKHAIPHSIGYHTLNDIEDLYVAFETEPPKDEDYDEMQVYSGGRYVDPRTKS